MNVLSVCTGEDTAEDGVVIAKYFWYNAFFYVL